jgi:hypothetical protein
MQCSECPMGWGNGGSMKTNNPLNIKIDDRLLQIVNNATNCKFSITPKMGT